MKSLANSILYVALAVFEDIRVEYPDYKGLDRDIERFTLNYQKRGLGFITLDLPEIDAMLLRGLESGRLDLIGPLSSRRSKRLQVPKFLSGLWLRVFDGNSCLRVDVDRTAILFLRQIFCLGKKLEVPCSPQRLLAAVEEYHDVESKIRRPSLEWDRDDLGSCQRLRTVHLCDSLDADLPLFPGKRDEEVARLLGRVQQVADLVADAIGPFESVSYSSKLLEANRGAGFRHGPGAVADRNGRYDKYTFTNWPDKLEEWFPFNECGTFAGSNIPHPTNHELPARLIAVPKTAKSPRLIAAEPAEHQWCQQLIRQFLVDRIRSLFGSDFIDFSRQDLSGDMALKASLSRSECTIDLSSASDRLSCFVVERVLRRNPLLLSALHSCRTRWVYDNLSSPPRWVKLNKFASQGTAVTFPIQSLVFFIIAAGVTISKEINMKNLKRLRKRVRVFGDDIILPNTRYSAACDVLHTLGLKVNTGKSFSKGYFRESCGVDAYMGVDVTPIKLRHLSADGPTLRMALIDSSNNLFMKGYWRASKAIISILQTRFSRTLPVVGLSSGRVGLVSFCGMDYSHLKTRWNYSLHRIEALCYSISSKQR